MRKALCKTVLRKRRGDDCRGAHGAGVLDLDVDVRPHRRLRLHRHDVVTNQVQQQIQPVDPLIDQRPSAVKRLGAFPAAVGVVFLRPVEFHVAVELDGGAQVAALHRRPHLLGNVEEPQLEDHAELHAVG
eukprot:COSAG04_NODE_1040_length_8590_cov_8.212974_5_plen_130_part_00